MKSYLLFLENIFKQENPSRISIGTHPQIYEKWFFNGSPIRGSFYKIIYRKIKKTVNTIKKDIKNRILYKISQ